MQITTTMRYVLSETSLIEAVTGMRDLGVSALPVHRMLSDGSRLRLGVLTEHDITCRAVAAGMNPVGALASDVMTHHQAPTDATVGQDALDSIVVT